MPYYVLDSGTTQCEGDQLCLKVYDVIVAQTKAIARQAPWRTLAPDPGLPPAPAVEPGRRPAAHPGARSRSDRLVAEAVAVADQAADRVLRLVREHDHPVLVGGLGEQLGLADDRVEREVVERGHPARVGAPTAACSRSPKNASGPARPVRRPAHDDRLVAGRMAAGRDDA